jgi:hypothetical protein
LGVVALRGVAAALRAVAVALRAVEGGIVRTNGVRADDAPGGRRNACGTEQAPLR